ncbi:hypothetical protein MnTg04_00631 [bacterium MnTg04]|nr:hypothetical protein MnTg04_00631 [bacterium MnTg04]
MPGIPFQYSLVGDNRRLQFSCGVQADSFVKPGGQIAGIQPRRRRKGIGCIQRATFHHQDGAEIVISADQFRIAADRVSKTIFRLVEFVLGTVDMTEIVMHLGKPWPDGERSQERIGRLVELATIIQYLSQIVVNRCILRIQLQGLEVAFDGLFVIALLLEHHAETVVSHGQSRLELQRLPVNSGRFGILLARPQDIAKRVEETCLHGVDGDGLADQPLGVIELTERRIYAAKGMQRIGVFGVQLQCCDVMLPGLFEPTMLVGGLSQPVVAGYFSMWVFWIGQNISCRGARIMRLPASRASTALAFGANE